MATDQPAAAQAQALWELLAQRHSCRDFSDALVPRETVEHMLEMAQRTASWCNTQPWTLYLARGANARELARKLSAAAEDAARPDIPFPEAYEGEHLARRREAGFQLYQAVGVARGDREGARQQALRNFDLFGAPQCVIVTMPAYLGPYAAVDCGGWIANFLLAAQAHGVAAIAQAALARQAPVLRAHFGIPPEQLVVCGISFGVARDSAANAYRTRRAPVADACIWHEH